MMNALGGLCWAVIFGLGAYKFGQAMTKVAAPAGVALLLAGLTIAIASVMFFRRHEKQLELRAELAFPGPLTPEDRQTS